MLSARELCLPVWVTVVHLYHPFVGHFPLCVAFNPNPAFSWHLPPSTADPSPPLPSPCTLRSIPIPAAHHKHTMDLRVYMHNGCPAFARSPNLMLQHLRTEHSTVTAPLLATENGIALLDAQISEHLLAVAPPGTATNVCLTCNIIIGTRFEAVDHLSLPQHIIDYSRILQDTGDAGISVLLDRRWFTTTLEAEHKFALAPARSRGAPQSAARGGGIAASPGGLRYLQSFHGHDNNPRSAPRHTPVIVRLTVRNYTTRARFPPSLTLVVVVPRTTRTVADLAVCIEAAFAADPAGEAGTINWSEYIATCGIAFRHGGGGIIRTDVEIAAWITGAGEEEVDAEIKRRIWVAGI